MKRYPMTPEGKQKLEKELRYLTSDLRHKIIKDIAEARAHGDISENSEYEDAKERQALCEGRISDIKAKLSLVQVINVLDNMPDEDSERKVIFGSTVVLGDEEGKELTYRIVGFDEADLKSGTISYQSPIARGIIGKEEGEEVQIQAPRGLRTFEIIEVKYI